MSEKSNFMNFYLFNNKYVSCMLGYHCGSLKESLKTFKIVEKLTAFKLIDIQLYEFYCYDYRIKADRYILIHHERNIGLPTWINCYLNENYAKH